MKKKPADKPYSLPLRCAIYARTATVKKPVKTTPSVIRLQRASASPEEEGGLLGEIVSSPILDIPASP